MTRLLEEKSAHRVRVATELTRALDGEVRVGVGPGKNHARYAALLADILHGANIRPASFLDTIAQRIAPSVLVSMAEQNETGPLVEIDPAKRGKEERAARSSRSSARAAASTRSSARGATTRRSSS